MEDPREKNTWSPQAELGLTHMWHELGFVVMIYSLRVEVYSICHFLAAFQFILIFVRFV